MAPRYMFADAAAQEEFERLQTQEAAFDWVCRGRLQALGLGPGQRCLEAGVGAGSMLRWMAQAVAPGGQVVGVDLDDRFFPASADTPGVVLQRGDLLEVDMGEGCFDVVHARLLLLHLADADRSTLLAALWRALRPGGWLVVFDPDLRTRIGGPGGEEERRQHELLDRFLDATAAVADYTIGAKHPALLRDAGFVDVESMVVLPHLTAPDAAAGNGAVHHTAMRNMYRAVCGVVTRAGTMADGALEQFMADHERGRLRYNFASFLSWGRKPR